MNYRYGIGRTRQQLASIVQRVFLRAADALRWHTTDIAEEPDDHELFANVGFIARPPKGANAEAIAVRVGARDHGIIVATRDAETLQAVVAKAGLGADETLVYTSKVVVKITADGEVLIGRIGGEFKAVALADHKHDLPPMQAGPFPVAAVPAEQPPDWPPEQPFPPNSPGTTGPCNDNSNDTKVT